MGRILKPSDKLVITDLNEHTFKFLRPEHHDPWMGLKREDIKQWFIKAGLSDVETDCLAENCYVQSNRGTEYVSISIFMTLGEKR